MFNKAVQAVSLSVGFLLLTFSIFASYEIHLLKKQERKKNLELNEVKEKYETLDHEKETLHQKNAELHDKIDSLQEKVNSLEEQISKKKKKKEVTLASRESWQTFKATYYDAGFQSTGKRPGHPAYGITKSGRKVKEGVTIAVDPNVIPLGTWIYVKYPDGRIEKRRADDTGGLVKGRHIDIYVPDASGYGTHPVEVFIP